MPNKFMYVFSKPLADKYISEGLILMKETEINNKHAYLFTLNSNKLKFSLEDKSKILFTNKLFFN